MTNIEHSGTKGMHWHERRYQYEDGTYTPEGKARRRVGNNKGNVTEGKTYATLSRKERRHAKKAAKEEQERREAFKKGDIHYLNKHAAEMTNKEIDDFVTRYSKLNNVRTLSENELKNAQQRITRFADKWVNRLENTSKVMKSVASMKESYDKLTKSSTNSGEKKSGNNSGGNNSRNSENQNNSSIPKMSRLEKKLKKLETQEKINDIKSKHRGYESYNDELEDIRKKNEDKKAWKKEKRALDNKYNYESQKYREETDKWIQKFEDGIKEREKKKRK